MSRCDSCGMPLNDATQGTEAGGTLSTEFCVTCYSDGVFTAPNATIAEVRESANAALVAQGIPPLTATRLTSGIASLPRWS